MGSSQAQIRLGLLFLPQSRLHQSPHCHLVKVSLILSEDIRGGREVCENVLNMRVFAHHRQHGGAVESLGCLIDQSEMDGDVFIKCFQSFIIEDWLQMLHYHIQF